jgi:hypothetical protein
MQDLEKLASKNGILLADYGRCQFCGSHTKKGARECYDTFHNILHRIEFNRLEQFLIVDAHCLQHPEIHGRWNNHYHLTRLHLILKRNIKWDFKKTPLLSNILDLYKKNKDNEVIMPPPPFLRGKIVITDISDIKIKEKFNDLVRKYANEVYESYEDFHHIAMAVEDNYLSKYEKY